MSCDRPPSPARWACAALFASLALSRLTLPALAQPVDPPATQPAPQASGPALSAPNTPNASNAPDAPAPGAGLIDAAARDADDPSLPGRFRVGFYWENDSRSGTLFRDADRHYTSGIGLSGAVRTEEKRGFARWMDSLTFEADRLAVGVATGHLLFTPEDLTDPDLIPNDRPYAAYAFGGVFLQRQQGDRFEHLELDLGIVGPSALGEEVQTAIHENFAGETPRGWDNQLPDEPAIQATYRAKWRLGAHGRRIEGGEWDWEVIPHLALTLGTLQRHLETGATFRAGWNLPDDFGPGRLGEPVSATGLPVLEQVTFYGFTAVAVRIVEFNAFVEGSQFNDSHGVSAETFVGEFRVGFSGAWRALGGELEATYSLNFLTDEFDRQSTDDVFGSLVIAFRWRD